MKLYQPWPEGYSVNPNGKYGMRRHPITGRQTKHRGLDVAGVFPVSSAAPGVVAHIGWSTRLLLIMGKFTRLTITVVQLRS
jgi:murein DD-endopeptidase MepM/ murein hydrolase activator NlpD